MKKTILTVILIVCIAMSAFCGGSNESKKTDNTVVNTNATTPAQEVTSLQTSSSPAADVELIKKTSISKGKVKESLKAYTDAGLSATEDQILDEMINSELIAQAMERDEINLDEEFSNYVLSAAAYYASQYGITFNSTADVDKFFQALGTTTEVFAKSLEPEFQTAAITQYVETKYADDFENMPEITATDIDDFYNRNIETLANSEKVKIAHVFFSVTDEATESSVKAAAQSVSDQIKAGTLTFEKAVSTYSQDTSNNEDGGVLGWVNQPETMLENAIGAGSSEYHKQLFTEDTYNALFALDEGEISDVLKSAQGYHIFKIIRHVPAKKLALTDKVYPEATGTVSDFCKAYLEEALYEATISASYSNLIDSLRAEAKITRY